MGEPSFSIIREIHLEEVLYSGERREGRGGRKLSGKGAGRSLVR